MLEKYRYIVVEGPIGVRNTALAQKIADKLKAATLLSQPRDNPFFKDFLVDMPRYALATQLNFHFQHVSILKEFSQSTEPVEHVVSDFLLGQGSIYAEACLTPDEKNLFKRIVREIDFDVTVPDLVIYLSGSIETLLNQLAARFPIMPSEQTMRKIREAYDQFFYNYDKSPLLVVNIDNLALIDNEEDFELLLHCIRNMRGSREFFNRN